MGVDRLVMLLAGVDVDPRGDPVPAPAAGADERGATHDIVNECSSPGWAASSARASRSCSSSGRGPTEIVGVDFVPPRRRLRRAEFRRIDPRDRDQLAQFVEEFAPNVVAHFGVYEPSSRMTPGVRDRAHRAVHDRDAERRRARRQPRVRRRPQRARGLRPARRARVGARRRRRCPRRARRTGARCSRSRRSRAGVRAAPRRAGVRAALRAGRRLARAEPARPVAAPAGRAGARVRRPAVLAAAPRRRGARRWSPRSSAATTARSTSSVRARRRRGRRCGSAAACRSRCCRRSGTRPRARRRGRGRGDRAARRRAAAPRPHRATAAAPIDALGLTDLRSTQKVLRELFEWADVVPIPTAPGGSGVSERASVELGTTTGSTSTASAARSRCRPPCAAGSTAAIRSTVRPRSADRRPRARRSCRAVVRVDVTGGEHVPTDGGAVLVANRGFGIFEPAALGVAVRRARPAAGCASSARRPLPFARRARPPPRRDRATARATSSTCLRAGHLVAVPLAPTWLRTGAGIAAAAR